jgi:hypothetical protein
MQRTALWGAEPEGHRPARRAAPEGSRRAGEYALQAMANDGSDSFEEAGRHIVIRRRTDDGWKIVWEIWNLDETME